MCSYMRCPVLPVQDLPRPWFSDIIKTEQGASQILRLSCCCGRSKINDHVEKECYLLIKTTQQLATLIFTVRRPSFTFDRILGVNMHRMKKQMGTHRQRSNLDT